MTHFTIMVIGAEDDAELLDSLPDDTIITIVDAHI